MYDSIEQVEREMRERERESLIAYLQINLMARKSAVSSCDRRESPVQTNNNLGLTSACYYCLDEQSTPQAKLAIGSMGARMDGPLKTAK